MEIIPAIDLLENDCVRLVQGRYDRLIHYRRDPVEVAGEFQRAGATWLHVVDLEGARDGRIANLKALARLAALGLRIEFGGGVRDADSIRAALEAGAARVIVGTRALEDREWFRSVAYAPEFAGRLALGLDARLGKLAVRGWTQELAGPTAVEEAERLAGWPIAALVYTDISRDGLLLGPNVESVRALASVSPVPVIASGGVSELADVRRLRRIRLAGVVIGRALYEGAIDLREAIKAAREEA